MTRTPWKNQSKEKDKADQFIERLYASLKIESENEDIERDN